MPHCRQTCAVIKLHVTPWGSSAGCMHATPHQAGYGRPQPHATGSPAAAACEPRRSSCCGKPCKSLTLLLAGMLPCCCVVLPSAAAEPATKAELVELRAYVRKGGKLT